MTETEQQFLTLNDWYRTQLGQVVAAEIIERIAPIVRSVFGYHAVQLGLVGHQYWLDESPIKHKIYLSEGNNPQANVLCSYEALPFATKSIDFIFAPHALSYCSDVMQVLAEIDRVLVSHGQVIFVGFNPVSWWGLTKAIFRYSNDAPWNMPYIGTFHLARALREYGYVIGPIQDFFYRPPLSNANWLEKCLFFETIGDLVWPFPGSLYLLHAQKQTCNLTRIKPLWSFRNIVVGKRYVQPIG